MENRPEDDTPHTRVAMIDNGCTMLHSSSLTCLTYLFLNGELVFQGIVLQFHVDSEGSRPREWRCCRSDKKKQKRRVMQVSHAPSLLQFEGDQNC